jgi:hypothetical protein
MRVYPADLASCGARFESINLAQEVGGLLAWIVGFSVLGCLGAVAGSGVVLLLPERAPGGHGDLPPRARDPAGGGPGSESWPCRL